MGCLSPELLKQYPRPVIGLFSSTVDDANASEFTPLSIADTDIGMIAELEKAGQHAEAPGAVKVLENPYSTRLRPLTIMSNFYKLKAVPAVIESVLFYALDSSVKTPAETEPVSGNNYQDLVVAGDLITSQAEVMDANYASRFRNTIIGNWQPNWFRPVLKVNGQNILANLAGTELTGTDGNKDHKADLSMGLPLPFQMDMAIEYPNGINSIEVFAEVVQYIPNTASARKYVRYPVVAVVNIWHQ